MDQPANGKTRVNEYKTPPSSSTGYDYDINNVHQNLSIKQTPKLSSKYLQYKCLTGSTKKYKKRYIETPIKKIRINVSRREELLDLRQFTPKSFESNQSFPKVTRHYNNDLCIGHCNLKEASAMEKIRVDGSNGLRFPLRHKRCYTPKQCTSYNNSLIASSSETTTLRDTKAGINPNKAVFTIDSKTSQILIVNNNACKLLNYTSRELTSMSFSELLTSTSKSHVCALAEVHLNCEDGTIVLLSGKVVEMNTKLNTKVAVSLWIRQIDNDGRCLAVAEPVERRVCQFVIDKTGLIQGADYESLIIFQFEQLDKIIGMDITFLIPAIQLPSCDNAAMPKHIKKQKATGKTGDGIAFPLCLLFNNPNDVNPADNLLLSNPNQYVITVWVFQNLSGLIVADECGTIESCNHHFSMLMFGYPQAKIINQSITKLIPHFGEDFEYVDFNRSRNVTVSSLDKSVESGTETDAVCLDSNEVLDDNDIHLDENMKNFDFDTNQEQEKSFNDTKTDIEENFTPNENIENELLTPVNDNSDQCYNLSQNNDFLSLNEPLTPTYNKDLEENLKLITSTPDDLQSDVEAPKIHNFLDGKYKGEAIHSDGNIIDILYTISNQQLPCGRKVYCVWICRDPDTIYAYDEKHQNLTLTFNSINSTIEHSLGQAIKNTAAQNYSRPNSVLLTSQYEDDQWLTNGEYNKYYTTLKQIGKGAYGYVKMAYRNSDKLLVVSKFILKDKLCPQFLITTDDHKEIPMEIYLLTRIKHPNIVSVLDVFENEKFFQLVMEKHGSGMDLFEFIDRRPIMDEPLGSYIFRQIIDAVDYLHKNSILHRDIKDENIIIDHNFHIKLIDFGSATYMEEGKLFSTFFGTTEYCSPEVLAGNKYAGPELEIWSLGVTLYVLIFFENPFIDIEETLRADLLFPTAISVQLENLLLSMLDKDPRTRCTMKELTENLWINQDLSGLEFNFAQIVPCESFEAKPEKYFSEQQIVHNNIGTISPQNSLSLIDGDSIIDGDDDDDEIEFSPIVLEDKVASNLAEIFETKLRTTNDAENESDNEYLSAKQNDSTSTGLNNSKQLNQNLSNVNINLNIEDVTYDSWDEIGDVNESFS